MAKKKAAAPKAPDTLAQFRATGRYVSDLSAASDGDVKGPGRVYDTTNGTYYLVDNSASPDPDVTDRDGRWGLTFYNESWCSSDLEALEARLYLCILDDGGF